jgi:hypothetical protein
MPRLIEIERKAAAIGFLRADPPMQTRIVQGCGIAQTTITNWINRDRLVYIDLKRPGALELPPAARSGPTRRHGRRAMLILSSTGLSPVFVARSRATHFAGSQ